MSLLRAAGGAAVVLGGGLLLWRHAGAVSADLGTVRDLQRTEYVGSAQCRRCHGDHDRSWRRTFHRTMTQEAAPGAVLGDFSGAAYRYGGVTARMDRDPAGAYRMTFTRDGAAAPETLIVERTVGSRRYQQYLARRADTFLRLPMAWHIEEGRWFHMNGAFLTPDPVEPTVGGAAGGSAGGSIARADYERHVVRWNDNCVFCHNVRPSPGLDAATGAFRTEVAELGIACEACHGPGGEHARRNGDPVRRYALHLGEAPDPTIVNPRRLSPARAADLCGRCHGQRITDDVGRFLAHGDPFVPGEDLALYSSPLWRETTLANERVFAARFWEDGTARLTAYEYQGLLQSPCAQRGPLTCTSCHAMHDGDPRGQVAPSKIGDAGCTGCHRALADGPALARHARHDPAGPGARCVGCHMPRIVYGVLDVHRSHRIEVPDPGRDAERGRPDACTGCHVDESREWAAAARTRLWPAAGAGNEAGTGKEAGTGSQEGPREWALGGDPIERSVAVDALGRSEAVVRPEAVAVRVGILLEAMETDAYPAVRRLAWRALRRLVERHHGGAAVDWMAYDPTGPAAARRAAARAISAALPTSGVTRPDPQRVAQLRGRAADTAIEIGE